MMKILFLNPQINAEYQVIHDLEEQGHGVLVPADSEEAWQMLQLHGRSVSLAIIHREGSSDEEEGLRLIQKIKAFEEQVDLPMILSSSTWQNHQFAEHQESPDGVNAYIHWPFSGEEILDLIGKVFQTEAEPEAQVDIERDNDSHSVEDLAPSLNLADFAILDDESGGDLDAPAEIESEYPLDAAPSFNLSIKPVGDAVVPGGAAQSPDLDTLKKYLLLREQDVGVLSSKLKIAEERILSLESVLKSERGRADELDQKLEEKQIRIDEFEKEKALALESLQVEASELRFQNKAKTDRARLLEQQLREMSDEIERLKERVRMDIRKIRVREKELENKLELMKKDSEALLSARENKIIELKRKVDLLEFNMDLLQDQHSREKENSNRLRERLTKAAQVVRVATGILDSDSIAQTSLKSEGEGSKVS